MFRPYHELGLASLDSFAATPPVPSASDLLARLRELGAQHGCDALLVNPPAHPYRAFELTATCIAYAERSVAAVAADR